MERQKSESGGAALRMDPIRFEVMRCAFAAAADEMAATLRKTAYSTNIKTRADFSCAIFDDRLGVIAQSFSQPIHLACMTRMIPAAVRRFRERRGGRDMRAGEGIAMNDPHNEAMHLNDIAIIVPYFHGEELAGYTAAVAHHVDIGGQAPGGLCVSTDIYQEGLTVPSTQILSDGEIIDNVFDFIVANIRSPRQMAGDLRAQVASTKLGEKRVAEIIDRYGLEAVRGFTDELIDYTRRWTYAEILKLPEGEYHAECEMDDDGVTDEPIKLVLRATVRDGRVSFDLTGSDLQRASTSRSTRAFTPRSM